MIKIVTKDYCPYCIMAKELIKSLWFDYEEIDVSDDPDKLREIVQVSMMMTVPQIYVWEIKNENLLGLYSDIEALNRDWKLIDILKS